MNTQKGFAPILALFIVLGVIVVGGVGYTLMKKNEITENKLVTPDVKLQKEEVSINNSATTGECEATPNGELLSYPLAITFPKSNSRVQKNSFKTIQWENKHCGSGVRITAILGEVGGSSLWWDITGEEGGVSVSNKSMNIKLPENLSNETYRLTLLTLKEGEVPNYQSKNLSGGITFTLY